jgi:hypothetical protein
VSACLNMKGRQAELGEASDKGEGMCPRRVISAYLRKIAAERR